MPREGVGLLQGRVVCGLCGARMRVRYQEVEGKLQPYYMCTENAVRRADKACQSVRGRAVDDAISTLLLERVAPAAINVALAVEDEIAGRIRQSEAQRLTQLARARYDAELARRRYMQVDPANRLVADALEADWNERLRQLDFLQQAHDCIQQTDQRLLDDAARSRIRQLAHDFPRVWHDERIASVERKRMVALLIEDVTLIKAERITMHVRFRGGATTSLDVEKPKPIAQLRKTPDDLIRAVDALLETCSDCEVAQHLNRLGYKTWQGLAFTAKKVVVIRLAYALRSRLERLREQGMLSANELAHQLAVCVTTIHAWRRAGLLREHRYGKRRCLYEPPGNAILATGKPGQRPEPTSSSAVPTSTQGAL